MKLKLAAGSEKCEGLKQDSLPVRFIFLIFFFFFRVCGLLVQLKVFHWHTFVLSFKVLRTGT